MHVLSVRGPSRKGVVSSGFFVLNFVFACVSLLSLSFGLFLDKFCCKPPSFSGHACGTQQDFDFSCLENSNQMPRCWTWKFESCALRFQQCYSLQNKNFMHRFCNILVLFGFLSGVPRRDAFLLRQLQAASLSICCHRLPSSKVSLFHSVDSANEHMNGRACAIIARRCVC